MVRPFGPYLCIRTFGHLSKSAFGRFPKFWLHPTRPGIGTDVGINFGHEFQGMFCSTPYEVKSLQPPPSNEAISIINHLDAGASVVSTLEITTYASL